MAGLMSSMADLAFPDATAGDFAINVLTVLILYGPAYLANTGAMLFENGFLIKSDLTTTKSMEAGFILMVIGF